MGQEQSYLLEFQEKVIKYISQTIELNGPEIDIFELYSDCLAIDFDRIYQRTQTDSNFKFAYENAFFYVDRSLEESQNHMENAGDGNYSTSLIQILPLISLLKIGYVASGLIYNFCTLVLNTRDDIENQFRSDNVTKLLKSIPFKKPEIPKKERKLTFGKQPKLSPCPKRSIIFEQEHRRRSRDALNERLRHEMQRIPGYNVPMESHYSLPK